MKNTLMGCLLFTLCLAASTAGWAQADRPFQAHVFVAPGGLHVDGGNAGFIQYGAGVEGFVNNGFAVGADVGYAAPFKAQRDGFGILNLNGGYHFGRKTNRVVPFVTGGYSLRFREGTGHGFNVGAGVTWWATERYGLRLEFRDQIFPSGGAVHVYGARIGFTFR